MVASSQGLTNDSLVLVPVPVSLVLGVYEYITATSRSGEEQRMTELPPTVDTITTPGTVQPRIDWTRVADCQRLRDGLPGSPTLRALDYLADHPGELVSFGGLAEASGIHREALRGRLAGLTMRIKSLWNVPKSEAKWPMRVDWEQIEARYEMSEEVARAWRQAG
jgi:hypothetical protein